jgi:hypothetical protein
MLLVFCTVCIEERPGAVGIDRVASVRRGIGPILDFTVGASGRADEAAHSISVKDVDANLSDRAAHDIVHARPAEGVGPFEAGNATAAMVVIIRRGMHPAARQTRTVPKDPCSSFADSNANSNRLSPGRP